MSYITAIGTANPEHKFNQSTIADFMVRAMQLNDDDTRRLRALFRMTGIETRYSVISDYGKQDDYDFYSNSVDFEPIPSTGKRLIFYRQHALKLSAEAIDHCLSKADAFDKNSVTHLIVVSCTGMYAPGLDIDLIKTLGLPSHTQRLCINFMGCYAAFNGLKQADIICKADPNAKVLVVCTELCSIHFQKQNTDDNLLANALFADGSAALLVESSPRKGLNLKPVSFYCDLAPEGDQDMAWTVGDLGFEMRLSAYVPDIIQRGIKKLTHSLLDQISNSLSDIAYYAIHPGGKKILEVIEQELHLTKEQNKPAYEVLRNYGNMSSPTVLFVLNEVCKNLNGVDDGKKILSFAFGPGLTLESMVLEIQNH
jgi:prepilin-type processing-associated H-X9-DG protein